MSKFNEIDHIWIVLLVFLIVLITWVFTGSPWLENAGNNLITAILTLTVSKTAKALAKKQFNETEDN